MGGRYYVSKVKQAETGARTYPRSFRYAESDEAISRKPEALLRSIHELADVLPRLNIAGDTGIESAAQQLRTRILSFTAEDLRDNEEVRTMAIDAAREITGVIGRKIRLPVPENVEAV